VPSKLAQILQIIQRFGGPIGLQMLAMFAPGAVPLAQLILGGIGKAGDFLEADDAAKALTDEQLQALIDKDDKELLANLDADIVRFELKLAAEKLAQAGLTDGSPDAVVKAMAKPKTATSFAAAPVTRAQFDQVIGLLERMRDGLPKI
jgi:hypothetical protein